MTSKEFVIWLKGFTEGVHEFNVTPKQWDLLKEKLEQVTDEPKSVGITIGTGGFGTTATPGYGSITYNPSTTTQMYPSGSVWHYTNGGNKDIKD